MLDAVVSLQYDRVEEHVRLDAEWTVHVRVTVGAVRVGAQHWFVVVLGALDSNAGVSLEHTIHGRNYFTTFVTFYVSVSLSLRH